MKHGQSAKRPLSVTLISALFLVAGVVGLVYHASEFKTTGPFRYDLIWVCLVRLLAVVGAIFAFRGSNWARWVLILWIAFHAVLSAFHSASELIMHTLLLAIIAYFLLAPKASAYFRSTKATPADADDQT